MGKKIDNLLNGDFSIRMQAIYWCHIPQGQAEYGGSMDFATPPTPLEVLPSDGWRTVTTITWAGVFGALLAVAISSRTIGRPIWWLGPSSAPASPFLITIPLALVVIPLLATLRAPRHMTTASWVCSLALIGTGIAEMASNPAISIAVVVIGVAALMESIAVVVVMHQYR
jgi:hypothetical protein